METLERANYQQILNTVRQWPMASRFALVQDILKTIEPAVSRSQRETLTKALGLLKTDQPAPSDADVKAWLDEHRIRKYA